MSHRIRLFGAAVFFVLGCGSNGVSPAPDAGSAPDADAPPDDTSQSDAGIDPSLLVFIPDEGIRVEYASNAGVKLDGDEFLLLFEDRSVEPTVQRVATSGESSDWLTFGTPETISDTCTIRAIRLGDGTYRCYGYQPTMGIEGTGLTSRSSPDGESFTDDEGYRYELEPSDNGRMGVYDLYLDPEDNVVLLYIGDLFGLNNVRRAYSIDDGWTFDFEAGNVLGDDSAGGAANSYVDQRVVRLTDGSYYLIAMKSGSIYAFTSTDGREYTLLGMILTADDFTDSGIHSLHDPQIAALPDGRYRIIVTGAENAGDPDSPQHLFSATTAL